MKPPNDINHHDDAPKVFELPDLAAFRHTALPQLEDLPPPSVSSLDDFSEPQSPTLAALVRSQAQDEALPEDLWRDPSDLPTLEDETRLHTWASFHNGRTRIATAPKSGFLSEAGAQAFDAALKAHAHASKASQHAGHVVRSDALLNSLFELGLGRASIFFPRDKTTNRFTRAIEDGRMSGTSLHSSDNITARFLEVGNAVMRLRAFADTTITEHQHCAAKMSVASVVRVALDAAEEHLVYRRKDVLSLLQLQDLFERPCELLLVLQDLVDKVVALERDGAITSIVFGMLQELESRGHDLEIHQSIFARVSRPWLDELQEKVGLRQDIKGIKGSNRPSEQQGLSLAGTLPPFLDERIRKIIQETSTCVEHLREHVPSYEQTRAGPTGQDQASLDWTFQWQDIDRISTKAASFEQNLRIPLGTGCDDYSQQRVGSGAALPPEQPILDPWRQIPATDLDVLKWPQPTSDKCFPSPDELYDIILKHLSNATPISEPPPSHIPVDLIPSYSLTPPLRIQHHHLTAQVLHSLLHTHDLPNHLQTLHDFHLFGSGIFTTSLSYVLFAPDAESSERRKHVARSGQQGAMGLRLGSGLRRDWPPTNSELSLALAGVLESAHSDSTTNAREARQGFALSTSSEDATHPTSTATTRVKASQILSFSLRASISSGEIEHILNPSTIHALDFLTLSFTPPAALRIIFTTPVLEKYDRIFRFLLRLLRVQFVLGQGFASTTVFDGPSGKRRKSKGPMTAEGKVVQRFRHRAASFVTTLLTYIRHTAIAAPWRELMDCVHRMEASSAVSPGRDATYKADATSEKEAASLSLNQLQRIHETALNKILTLLFLRHRQRKIAEKLEGVLSDILSFALEVSGSTSGSGTISEGLPSVSEAAHSQEGLHAFEVHIADFVDALDAAAERAEVGKGGRGHGNRVDGEVENERDVIEAFGGLAELVRWPVRAAWDVPQGFL